jgi:hypothetical protein
MNFEVVRSEAELELFVELFCRQRSYHPIEVDLARCGVDLVHEPVSIVVHQVPSVSVPVSHSTSFSV